MLEHDSDKAVMIYADNSHHVSLLAQEANAMRESLSLALNTHGLATHEVVEATHIADGLGAVINMNAGVVSSQGKRVWRVKRSLRHIFCGRAITRAELENVIGSVTFVFLLNMPCLSSLDHAYPYIRRYYTVRRVVSSVVANELRVIMGLLFSADQN